MEASDEQASENGSVEEQQGWERPRTLPDDLPKSLDDRRNFSSYNEQIEYYDAWQGQSQFLTAPIPAQPLDFNLSLHDDNEFDAGGSQGFDDGDRRLHEMLASQARLTKEEPMLGDEEAILSDSKTSEETKKELLQSALAMAASNGDVEQVKRLVQGKSKDYVNVNKPDAEGTPPLIYASCFGHGDVVGTLLAAGANVDQQDRNHWSALMWAMTNRHKEISKTLLDHGASPDAKSASGRTAFDFVEPNSEMLDYLHESGYSIGNAGVTEDFYNAGFSQDRLEEEMEDRQMKQRMAMESAINLEVDLGNLGLDEQPEEQYELEEEEKGFVWDRCLNDQMFVFQESDLNRILDVIITNMTPLRSRSQKPIPANILFLSARYAHYHGSPELLDSLMQSAMQKIRAVVERHQGDMTVLAFWMSNVTLLIYYLRKDRGLFGATTEMQNDLSDIIDGIFILINRDAERRMEKVLDEAMLDYETIPGLEDVQFQNQWNLFKRPKAKIEEPIEKRYGPPTPQQQRKVSPRNIKSLLSSTLFVLDLYDIHSVISTQIIAHLFYWLGAEIFNRIISNKRYLARTKAMQIRMNISMLEDWARTNNRQPEHFESGATTTTGEATTESAQKHLAPVVQLLQWLQCFSSLGDDRDNLIGTLQQLPRLTPLQLIHTVKTYRAEVGEKTLPKTAMKYLISLQKEAADKKVKQRRAALERRAATPEPRKSGGSASGSPTAAQNGQPSLIPPPASNQPPQAMLDEDNNAPEGLLMNPNSTDSFKLPTSTDMLVTYGAGLGGTNRERERKYIPTVAPEFLAKLEPASGRNGSVNLYKGWDGGAEGGDDGA